MLTYAGVCENEERARVASAAGKGEDEGAGGGGESRSGGAAERASEREREKEASATSNTATVQILAALREGLRWREAFCEHVASKVVGTPLRRVLLEWVGVLTYADVC
jgi:hypothetical protein